MRHLGLFGILAVTACAAAQSFNIDLDVSSGNGSGAPTSSYGAGAGQPGHWNVVRSNSPVAMTLTNTAGNPTTVLFHRATNGSFTSAAHPNYYGDWEKLNEDVQVSNPGQSLTYSFSNLSAGTYALFTYSVKPDEAIYSNVYVLNTSSQVTQRIGQLYTVNGYMPGRTHAIHIVQVSSGDSISVNVMPENGNSRAVVGGFQLMRLTAPRLRFYVDDTLNSATDFSGRSWENHFRTLQSALDTALLIGGPNCEIWMARGTYYCSWDNDRTRVFTIPTGVHVFGGFVGTETTIGQRSAPWGTTLTGHAGASNTSTDNAYTVLVAVGSSADTLIDGVSITGAYNNSADPNWGGTGGGARLIAAAITFRNCSFWGNYAANRGGAVYSQSGSPLFINCFFTNNQGSSGGAIHHQGGGSLQLINCRISQNNASYGGALRVLGGAILLANTYVQSNSATDTGGAIEAIGSTANVSALNCTVVRNSATVGGGFRATSGADLFLYNSIFWFNTDQTGGPVLAQQYSATGSGSTTDVARTTAQGATGIDGEEPLFVDADGYDNIPGTYDDNLRLATGSPCVDSGDNSLVLPDTYDLDGDGDVFERLPLDFDGESRFADDPQTPDTGIGIAPLIDRGAWEYQPPVVTLQGDMNCDGVINNFDIDPFVLALTDAAAYAAAFPDCEVMNADVNGDGLVNNFDIDAFVTCVALGGCP